MPRMNRDQVLELIGTRRIIAILRGDFGGREEEIVHVLAEAGITAVEVTLNSPNALGSIGRLATRFGSRLAVGAGTVLRLSEVEKAADAGARFIVSPNCSQKVIAVTKQFGMVSLPGCFTPSEIVDALDAGADAVKLFPAQCLGVEFVRAMQGPLRGVRMVPTGGVTPEAARDDLAAGAWAVGVGSELIKSGDLEALRLRAREYVMAVRSN